MLFSFFWLLISIQPGSSVNHATAQSDTMATSFETSLSFNGMRRDKGKCFYSHHSVQAQWEKARVEYTQRKHEKRTHPLCCVPIHKPYYPLSLASNRPSPNFPSLFLPKRYLTDIHNEYRWQVQYPKITHTYAYRYNHPIPLSKTKRNTKKKTTMGSSHSKPKKHRQPVRKPQISYPRPHNPPSKQHQQQQTHHHLHHPLEPQYYGNSPAVHPHPQPSRPARPSLQPKAKPVSVYAPEVNYYGTFPAAVVARKRVVAKAEGNTMNKRVDGMKQQGIVRRKPVPPPQNRAQVEHYARRGLPPVPGSRAAVRSVKVQYGYC